MTDDSKPTEKPTIPLPPPEQKPKVRNLPAGESTLTKNGEAPPPRPLPKGETTDATKSNDPGST